MGSEGESTTLLCEVLSEEKRGGGGGEAKEGRKRDEMRTRLAKREVEEVKKNTCTHTYLSISLRTPPFLRTNYTLSPLHLLLFLIHNKQTKEEKRQKSGRCEQIVTARNAQITAKPRRRKTHTQACRVERRKNTNVIYCNPLFDPTERTKRKAK